MSLEDEYEEKIKWTLWRRHSCCFHFQEWKSLIPNRQNPRKRRKRKQENNSSKKQTSGAAKAPISGGAKACTSDVAKASISGAAKASTSGAEKAAISGLTMGSTSGSRRASTLRFSMDLEPPNLLNFNKGCSALADSRCQLYKTFLSWLLTLGQK